MTARRVEYIVRISFTKSIEGTLQEDAAAIMFDLMKDITAVADEAVVLHRQVIETEDVSPFWASRLGRLLRLVMDWEVRFRSAVRRSVRRRR